MTPVPSIGTGTRIAVLRALHLGDLLCAVPAFRALRRALPAARVTLIGLPWSDAFVRRFGHYLDDLLEFPGWPGLPEQPVRTSALPGFLGEAQARRFDLVLQLHGSGEIVNPLAVALGGRRTAGFYRPGGYCPDPESFVPYPDREPEVRRLLRPLDRLGVEPAGEQLEFPLDERDRAAFDRLARRSGLTPLGYGCLHPGARDDARRWPADRFAAVADALADRGIPVVLTGSADERAVTASVARAMRAPAIDLAGRTDLGAFAALVAAARVLVTNDTAASHVAAAVGTPSAVVFLASDPARWAPLDAARHSAVPPDRADVATVLGEVSRLLEQPVADAA